MRGMFEESEKEEVTGGQRSFKVRLGVISCSIKEAKGLGAGRDRGC